MPTSGADAGAAENLLDLTVGAVAHGGSCVARHDGRVVFVRHALPGEEVRVRITEDRGRYLRGDAVEVLVPSIDRVVPPCPYAGPGRCGGCDWQHVEVGAQRRLKARVVREQMRRLAGIDIGVHVEALPDVAGGGGPGLGWRTRMAFAVDRAGRVGLRRHRSLDIEPVTECAIAHPDVTDLGVGRRPWPDTFAVEVIAGGSGDRAIVVTPTRRGADLAVPPLDGRASVLRGDGRGHTEPVRGRPGVSETAIGRRWRVSGSGFWQVHPAAADVLADAVVAALDPRTGESALDLYCGVGLFGAALAPRLGPGGRVTAIESDPAAADDARHNLADLAMVRVETGVVDDVLTRLGVRRADIVVLDPPRIGAGADVVRRLAGLDCRRIAYVACDPAALARDVATFAEHGWSLVSLRAFDLFPMTAHVECLAVLEPQR